jgi:hypothetical protein
LVQAFPLKVWILFRQQETVLLKERITKTYNKKGLQLTCYSPFLKQLGEEYK